MKPIKKDELYEHLGHFLNSKGLELKEGSYTKSIHAACSFLADAINLSQAGIERAKSGIDKKLDQVRQVIHQKTAPKPPVMSRSSHRVAASKVTSEKSAALKSTARKSKLKKSKSRRR